MLQTNTSIENAAPAKPKKTGFRGTPCATGRPKGIINKNTRILKEAILLAAEAVGQDKRGKDGLVGYLKFVAVEEPASFCSLLGKVLPLTIQGDKDNPLVHHVKVTLVRAEGSRPAPKVTNVNAKAIAQGDAA